MSFTHEMVTLVQRHQEEKCGYRPELNEVVQYSHGKLCSLYLNALAHYKLQHHYFNLDDVVDPEEGMTVWIRLDGMRENYERVGGRWKFVQDLSDSIYG